MNEQEQLNYNRIAKAIDYIRQNFKDQPSLEEVANEINVSPFHFQRLFTEWAGVSPKKFLQYISIEHAKKMLTQNNDSLFDVALDTGLSGTGRLHDLFINIEGMTPGEFKNGGQNLVINYNFTETMFGNVMVASTSKGICHLSFADNEPEAILSLKKIFPNATLRQIVDLAQQNALYFFTQDWSKLSSIKLHLKGTEFQLKVWEALLKIPSGCLTSYRHIAERINHPKASRAVGTAIGDNPVAFLIPCHRVIQSSGAIGDYHWGSTRKAVMIGWEAAQFEH
ncbi:MAG TPA: methylated-DNA--[protein]-cysteine S-methyltransferase [Bacteroidales bacterium]